MNKKLLVFLLYCTIIVGAIANQQPYRIPLAGNAYEVGQTSRRSTVNDNGAKLSVEDKNPTAVYFKLNGTGEISLKLIGNTKSEAGVLVKFLGKSKSVSFGAGQKSIDIGKFNVVNAGYLVAEIRSIKGTFDISHLEVSGAATQPGMLYVDSKEYFYWGRRGPSCHLGYILPTDKDVSYYYNEVTVPVGEDVESSYFMANGFGEGYFGMQVNSPTERRILFSVWSPFTTDDPASIPDDQKIILLKKGHDVHTGEFGNEGSGGQSYLKYNWKAGQTYKFLLKGKPDGRGNTDYTAWFFLPEKNDWKLIASFKRPKTNTYLKRFHSFLENFNPSQGYLSRRVEFVNQWIYDDTWKPVTGAKLTVDGTYTAKQREDATGGLTKNGYFLKMGGFFNEIEKPGTVFKYNNTRNAPKIDFAELP